MPPLLLSLILHFTLLHSQGLQVITTTTAKEGEFSFAHSLKEMQEGEKWGWHSGKIGSATATSTLAVSFLYTILRGAF
jgi:hypothetical protein